MNSVVDALSSVLQDASPTGQLNAIRADGDTVKLVASDADGKQLPITITYLEASQYPRSGCLVLCEDGRYTEKLSKISASFQDSASLSGVLAKICAALDIPVDEDALRAADGSPNDGMEEDGSEAMSEGYPSSDDGSYGSGGDSDEEDKEVLIECGQRQGRWARFEEELEKEQSRAQALSMEQGMASKRQIFSSNEAFKMLSNELLGFVRRQYQGASVSADSAGDDVYTWNVELWKSAFKPGCQLATDMQDVSARWFVSSIQLRFSFMRGLHPFYPPRLEVVRPHLATPLPGALASHPLLRLDNWDPWLNMSQLLDNIKEFLEEYGSVDVSHPGNSTANNPDSAFSPVQMALARLEAITDVKPACYSQYAALYEARSTKARSDSPSEPQQVKKQKTDETTAAFAAPSAVAPAAAAAGRCVVWAKGVGYGYGDKTGPVWDPKAAAAAQAAQDEQLCELLQGLADALEKELADPGGHLPDAAAAGGSSSSAAGSSGQQQQQHDTPGGEYMAVEPTPQQQECLAAVQGSVLLPMLAQEFGKVAFPEMVSRHQYYQPLLAVLQALCRPVTEQLLAVNALPTLQSSAATAAGASSSAAAQQQQQAMQSVANAVRGLEKGATMYRERMAKQLGEYEKEAAKQASSSSAAAAAGAAATGPKVDKQTEALLTEARCSMQIADQLLAVVQKLKHLTTVEDAPAAADDAAARGSRGRRATRSCAAAAAADASQQQQQGGAAAAAACSYKELLKGMVLDSANIAARHKFKDEAAKDPMGLKKRVQKVTSEMAGIERLIDVSESSSIFVRVDEDNSFLWKVLITGPDDTPYSGGCFIFDMFFPPNYPNVPPKVLLITTGHGSVRFNPNLYNCGKVCLSLLGTWSGGNGEGWNADVSSAFQVLISIQSLILVPEPYFNEPGFEQRGDKTASNQYNQVIREACIRWAMIDQLQHPPAEFADVIRAHFKLRGPVISKQIQGWIDQASSRSATLHVSTLKALKTQFEAQLAKLE